MHDEFVVAGVVHEQGELGFELRDGSHDVGKGIGRQRRWRILSSEQFREGLVDLVGDWIPRRRLRLDLVPLLEVLQDVVVPSLLRWHPVQDARGGGGIDRSRAREFGADVPDGDARTELDGLGIAVGLQPYQAPTKARRPSYRRGGEEDGGCDDDRAACGDGGGHGRHSPAYVDSAPESFLEAVTRRLYTY